MYMYIHVYLNVLASINLLRKLKIFIIFLQLHLVRKITGNDREMMNLNHLLKEVDAAVLNKKTVQILRRMRDQENLEVVVLRHEKGTVQILNQKMKLHLERDGDVQLHKKNIMMTLMKRVMRHLLEEDKDVLKNVMIIQMNLRKKLNHQIAGRMGVERHTKRCLNLMVVNQRKRSPHPHEKEKGGVDLQRLKKVIPTRRMNYHLQKLLENHDNRVQRDQRKVRAHQVVQL